MTITTKQLARESAAYAEAGRALATMGPEQRDRFERDLRNAVLARADTIATTVAKERGEPLDARATELLELAATVFTGRDLHLQGTTAIYSVDQAVAALRRGVVENSVRDAKGGAPGVRGLLLAGVAALAPMRGPVDAWPGAIEKAWALFALAAGDD